VSRLPVLTDAPAVSCDTDVQARVTDPVGLAALGTRGVPGWLADRHGRRLKYLRLSVTDRCDLRCRYCMPDDGVAASHREDVMTFEETVRVVRVFRELGVQTVRITGGEPLVRKHLPELVRQLRDDAGIQDLALTTNATTLRQHAAALRRNGIDRINVSLDSLRPDVFAHMTRGGRLDRVQDGIRAAQETGFDEIKLNCVVVRGMNDDQLGEVVDWAWDQGIVPRFIELMPIGEGARLGRDAVVPVAEMKTRLGRRLATEPAQHRLDRGPAGYLPAADGSGRKVGFIGAVTDNFCHRCNRVRVTARGEIRACLASPDGFSLRDRIRAGGSDEELQAGVEQALFGKREGHAFYVDGITRHHAVNMSQTGG
jgi:cyclic pyranopterin phosphate synthase